MFDRVKYEGTDEDWLVWKFPSEKLVFGTTVVVAESQQAVFVREGEICDVLDAGRWTLSTRNLPLVGRLLERPFGGKTPFTAEVWFVNRRCKGGLRWGTKTPVPVLDPVYRIPVHLRAYGTWEVEVEDAARLLRRFVGTLPGCTAERVRDEFEAEIVQRFSQACTRMMGERSMSVLDLATRLVPLSDELARELRPVHAAVGLALEAVTVQSISVPEADLAKLRDVLGDRMEMRELADAEVSRAWERKRGFDALEKMAANPLGAAYVPGLVPPLPRPEPAPDAAAQPTVEERLARLKRLHEQGLIDADEYADRKRAVLDEL